MARLWDDFGADEADEVRQAELRKSKEDFGYALLPNNFRKKYSVVLPEGRSWNINSFHQIGMVDPYPKESQLKEQKHQLPTQFDDGVYHEHDYTKAESPKLKYIPSADIMVQIMRACCHAKTPQQLWFNER